MARAQAGGWNVVASTSTSPPLPASSWPTYWPPLPNGNGAFVGQRTRDTLAVKAAQGVRLGRPATLESGIVERILTEHAAGAGWSLIARTLNDEFVPTAHGGAKWHPSTVRAIVRANKATAA
jgi:hypothetical protein